MNVCYPVQFVEVTVVTALRFLLSTDFVNPDHFSAEIMFHLAMERLLQLRSILILKSLLKFKQKFSIRK